MGAVTECGQLRRIGELEAAGIANVFDKFPGGWVLCQAGGILLQQNIRDEGHPALDWGSTPDHADTDTLLLVLTPDEICRAALKALQQSVRIELTWAPGTGQPSFRRRGMPGSAAPRCRRPVHPRKCVGQWGAAATVAAVGLHGQLFHEVVNST